MYYIVETKEQLERLVTTGDCFIDLVSLSEEAHPLLTTPCAIYYNDFKKGYILPIKHSETFSLTLSDVIEFLNQKEKVYLLDSKWHSYYLPLNNTIDVNQIKLDGGEKIEGNNCYTTLHLDFYNKFKYQEEVNTLIPISKHYERCECLFDSIRPFIGMEVNLPWLKEFYDVYKWVESNGIKIDERVFDKYFEPNWKARSVKKGKIYTSYNLYNTTSRPTNTFNGINFLAFNKDNNSRKALIPENDVFVEFDFDGYHVRLIANVLDVRLPSDESIHTLLGRSYFGKQELTKEEYEESKKITFRQLYNGIETEYKNVTLFQKVETLIQSYWVSYRDTGYLLLPNGRRIRIENATPQKLFNYYVQCLETVNNVTKLIKLKALLDGKKSKVVLVVYDSILVDFNKLDGRETLDDIKKILEEDGYRVKVRIGSNYSFNS